MKRTVSAASLGLRSLKLILQIASAYDIRNSFYGIMIIIRSNFGHHMYNNISFLNTVFHFCPTSDCSCVYRAVYIGSNR